MTQPKSPQSTGARAAQAFAAVPVVYARAAMSSVATSAALSWRLAGLAAAGSAVAVRAIADATLPRSVRPPATPVLRLAAVAPMDEPIDGVDVEVAGVADEIAAPEPEPEPEPEPDPGPEPRPAVAPAAVPLASAAEPVVAPEHPADLPVTDWDHLTLGSLRARLARLAVEDLLVLLAYERAHAARPAVVTMLQNRVAKVQAETVTVPADAS